MKGIIVSAIVSLAVWGCAAQNAKDDTEKPGSAPPASTAADVVSTPPASAKKSVAKKKASAPKLGPKTNRSSYTKNPGGTIVGDKFVMKRFGVIEGRLQVTSAPKQIVFNLSSEGRQGAYPIATKIVLLPPGEKEWVKLEENVVVKGNVKKNYALKDTKPGQYRFQVWYGAMDKKIDNRPYLTVELVEMQ